ncbi:hypothetical protein P7C71_g1460, partial [Lecanoromycetidae sp. Uapishka_2]
MSFGFGVGDILAVSRLAHDIYKRFQNFDEQSKNLHDDTVRPQETTTGLVYLYCDYKKQGEQTLVNLLASLLEQLVRQGKQVSIPVKECYRRHSQQRSRPDVEEVWQLLRSEMERFSRTFIIIDAVDECDHYHQTRQKLLRRLLSIQARSSANLLITTRPDPSIVSEFIDTPRLEVRASEADIRKYVQEDMNRLPPCVQEDSGLQLKILDGLVKSVDGMYVNVTLSNWSLFDEKLT